MSDRTTRSIVTIALVLALAGGARVAAQNFRNDFYVHQFWAELEATPGGALAFSGSNAQSPAASQPSGSLSATPQGGGGASGAATGSSGGAPKGGAAAGSSGAPPQSGGAASGAASPSPHQAAITDILKEAQWVYSGTIYGFTFSYTPADAARGIAGTFDLKPIAQIKWGDPHLKVLNTRVQGSRLVARVLYTLVPFQERWTEGWDSNVYPSATGRGSSRYFLSYRQKMASYRDAVKEAIRDYLRRRIYNRPRKVTGQAVLRGNPYTIIDAGRYVTTLTVKLRIDKVEPYRVY